MDIRKIYEYALQREYEGKRFFEQNASRLSHPAASRAFIELAAEEGKHIEFIQGQIAALDKGELDSSAIAKELQGEGFYSQRLHRELFEQTVLEAICPDLPVLRLAYLIEADFAAFYANSAKQATGEAKKVLKMLAQWETGHEELFKDLHDKAYEVYNNMPWGG